NWNDYQIIQVASERAGHGGGDRRLHDKLFKGTETPDPYGHAAGLRDGVMSILIGVAARHSIEQGSPIKVASLTDLKPKAKREESLQVDIKERRCPFFGHLLFLLLYFFII